MKKEVRTIQVPVTMGIPQRKTDGSVKLTFITNLEINTDEYMVMDTYRQQPGWLLFRENEFTESEVPDENVTTDIKSASQRLRSILYVYHMQKDGDPSKFRTFYEETMEKYINKIKENLDAKTTTM